MITKIKFASIASTDQDRALEFWTEKMGFEINTDQPMGEGLRWIELGIPGAQSALVLFTPEGDEERIGKFQNITFQSDDVQASYAHLKERGVEFVAPPQSESWGTSVQFKDPDGSIFLISSR